MSGRLDIGAGTLWTMIWWVLKSALKFASNVILARLLTPQMFGVAAIGNTLMTGISMFSDFGIQQNMVRSTRNDAAYYQTAWTVQFLRGLALTLFIVLAAKPLSWLYQIDGLSTFLLIVAASNLSLGLNNIEVMRDYRHANLRRLALIDNAGAVIGLAMMVLWGWFSPSYVALAIGFLVSTVAFTAGTFVAYPTTNCRFRFERAALGDLVGFGKWVLVSTILAFGTMQMDRLALGRLTTIETLGFYSLAATWASLPMGILDQWAHRVFFPLASHYIRNGADEERILTARRLYTAMAATAAVILYAVSDILVATLYTRQYQDVAPMIRQLSIVFLLYTVEQSYSHLLVAQGRPQDKVANQVVSVVIFAVAIVPVYNWAGIGGAIALLATTAAVRTVWMAIKLFGASISELGYDIAMVAAFYTLGPLMHALVNAYDNRLYQIGAASLEGALAAAVALLAYRHLRRVCEAA